MKLFLGLATQDAKNAETGDQVAPGSPSCRPPQQPTAATSSRHFSQKIPRQARDCRFLKALQKMQPNDPYIIQQLAPATYKSEMPDKIQALWKAKDILMPLAPSTSSDAETVGLWGAVHKRLWEESKEKADLDQGMATSSRTTTTTASISPFCWTCVPR